MCWKCKWVGATATVVVGRGEGTRLAWSGTWESDWSSLQVVGYGPTVRKADVRGVVWLPGAACWLDVVAAWPC